MSAPASDLLLRRHAPVIQLSRGERYEPCSVDWYVRQCRVMDAGGKALAETVTVEGLPAFPGNAYLEPRDPKGVRPGGVDPTLYTRVVPGSYGAEKFVDLWYHVFYAYNGTLSPHQTDLEFVVVRIFGDGGKPSAVFMSAHSGGRWYDAGELEKREDGRVVAYAALESHALFPGPGTRHRFLGVGSDRVVAGGKALTDLPLMSADSVRWAGSRARGESDMFPAWHAWRMSRGFSVPDYSLPILKRVLGRWGAVGSGLALALAAVLTLALAAFAWRRRHRALAAAGGLIAPLGVLGGILLSAVMTDDPK